ncbi:MAG: hypothetical protein ACD_51C00017G0016 [uncultured bacterium]|nr:MAG: hypothetical protein ACD_51C00017G0016 [uncultured bacterium]OGJ47227.1 MAG: quinolinate synthase [Candidatus Peregrinibacteria bacterium RIFOXYA2_FULL_41_18]OGJ49182.1 MAG: quinolinate synthase [Candidatus Peregrinibacteria bacterium RIFOXYB12_FULL_41_12]OGJ53004.1 MAG: quinolinate synthase [Candidatus Peregrinibacteria bacterium RIFOXYB2_FULL_41_88]OGJ53289.1 MAG: quinolinate synthase [Candidatus Peregrinibacteria bacterium RIFOXYC2_FULL_41_22]
MNTDLKSKILALKKEKNAVIFAHNYQRAEVQEVADFVGDSFNLAQRGIETDADIIVFCGVSFMAETAKILTPKKKVLLPSLGAVCPMAAMIDVTRVLELKKAHPNAAVVCYVNTTADVKALCDICCTSANAVKIVNSLPQDEVIMVPDKNLADYVQIHTKKRIIPAEGFCYVHSKIFPLAVESAKSAHPQAEVLLHPECPPETLKLADKVLSTAGMLNHVLKSDRREFIIGTEEGMLEVLTSHAPDKVFYGVGGQCIQQKKVNLERVYECLRDEKNEITVDPQVAAGALKAITKMLKAGRND